MARRPIEHVDPEVAVAEWRAKQPRKRVATIQDIANISGVSKKTVSRIINESPLVNDETREVVKKIMTLVGYTPDPQARGLAFRHSFLVGLIYDNPNPQYVVNMQQGILSGLSGSDYELVVHPCNRTQAGYLERARSFVERQKLFGVILTPSVSEDDRLAEILRSANRRFIRIASVGLDHNAHMLITHDRVGARLAARHLADLGHTKFGLIEGRAGFRSAFERRSGFEDGLAEYGLKLSPSFVEHGDYTFASGTAAAERLMAGPDRPTAVFAANDEMAAGALQALRIGGVAVPEEMSVVGFDDFQIATTVWPRLTTIHSPVLDVGRHAAQCLLDPTSRDSAPEDGLLPTLVVRETSAPPKRSD